MIRAMIVDDERLARLALRGLLEERGDVEIVAEADGITAARKSLAEHPVDVVFLDVEMPGGSGFELCREGLDARVVFCTAYEHYAVRAFEVNALDYLVKPVSPELLDRALRRLEPTAPRSEATGALELGDLVSLREGTALHFAPVRDITFIQAADDYSEVHLVSGKTVLVDVTLKSWEDRLPERDFVRIHRSSMVNLHHVREVRHEDGRGQVILTTNDAPLEVSRRMSKTLKARLADL